MFKYSENNVKDNRTNELLQSKVNKLNSDIQYLAMMLDVDLEQEDYDRGDENVEEF